VAESKLAATIDAKPFVPAQGGGAHHEARQELDAKCFSWGAKADARIESHGVVEIETEAAIEISAPGVPNSISEAKIEASINTSVSTISQDLSMQPATESSLESNVASAPVEFTAADEPAPGESTMAAESDARKKEVECGVCPLDPISREDEGKCPRATHWSTCDKTPPRLEVSHSPALS
jgi:hypothetical protein